MNYFHSEFERADFVSYLFYDSRLNDDLFSDCPFPENDFSFGSQPFFDEIPASPENALLGKTCEKFCHSADSQEFLEKVRFENKVNAAKSTGQTRKDVLMWDIQKALYEKQKQNRLIPKIIEAASDFSVLRDMREMQNGKQHKSLDDLKLLDFNGTDALKTDKIASGLKISDFHYTDFKQVRAIDDKTGEIFTFNVKGKGNKKKYILQSSRSALDDRLSLQRIMAKLLPEHRVSKCLHCVQDKNKHLSVYKSAAHSSVTVSNLQTCGSVWHCPFCAAKITEKRRKELNQIIDLHKENGGSVTLVTRTVPHTKKDALLSLRDRFRASDKFMKSHRQYLKMCTAYGVEHQTKSYEITVTPESGWHLHIHELFLHNAGAFDGQALESNPNYSQFIKSFERSYYKIWRDSAVKAGFDEPSEQHGLIVQNGDFAAEYVSKWGHEPQSTWDASAELTKGHIKSSRKGFTPFEIMRLYRDTGDSRLVPILKEYAHTMFKQQQLIYSKGLKKAFDIQDKTDEQLAEEIDDVAEEIGILSPVQWKFIVKNEIRSEFLSFAADSWESAHFYLHSFKGFPLFSMAQSFDMSD